MKKSIYSRLILGLTVLALAGCSGTTSSSSPFSYDSIVPPVSSDPVVTSETTSSDSQEVVSTSEEPIESSEEPAESSEEPVVSSEEISSEEPIESSEEPAVSDESEEPLVSSDDESSEEPAISSDEPSSEEPAISSDEPSSEEPIVSSEDPISSEEPIESSEEPVSSEESISSEEPVVSSEDSSSEYASSEQASSEQPSSEAPVVEARSDVVFTATGSESAAQWKGNEFTATGEPVSLVSSSKIFFSTSGALKMGSSREAGSVTFNLGPAKVEKVIVSVSAWLNSSGRADTGAAISVSTDKVSAVKKTVTSSKASYELDFSSKDVESSTITFTSTGRIYFYSFSVIYGNVEPVYPTSIAVPTELEVQEGRSKKINITYSPSNTNVKQASFSSDNEKIATVDKDGKVYGVALGETNVHITVVGLSGNIEKDVRIVVTEVVPESKVELKHNYKEYIDHNIYDLSASPSVGETNLLVIPVWFTDSTNYIKTANRDAVRADIQNAYFGTQEQTGWHSVKTFYETESMGALTVNGTVSEWYEPGQSSSVYYDEDNAPTADLVVSASDWYFSTHSGAKRADYDGDGDGWLDGVMLIYAAPDYDAMDKESASNLWAYCYWVQDTQTQSKTNPGANVFFWASYDFLYDSSTASSKTGKSDYSSGDCSHCTIDAHTFTHEMGHVFGLDDYYDYSTTYKPAGRFSMQDENIGGHDPYSVMALGWANPYIPTDSTSITIGAFQSTHDLILLTPEWNDIDSPFDEYLLLELYTPTGLNEFDCKYSYDGRGKGPSSVGIRLWHVDARLLYCNGFDRNDEPIVSINQMTVDPTYDSEYGVYLAWSNSLSSSGMGSYLGSSYDKYDQLSLIRNNKNASLHGSDALSDSSLFKDGSSFSMSDFSKQFANTGKLNSGKNLGWSFTVSISGTGASATATIDLVRD